MEFIHGRPLNSIHLDRMIFGFNLGRWRDCAWVGIGKGEKKLGGCKTGWKSCFLSRFVCWPGLSSIYFQEGWLNGLHACIMLSRKEHEMAARQTFTCCVLCHGCSVSMCRNPRWENHGVLALSERRVCLHKGRNWNHGSSCFVFTVRHWLVGTCMYRCRNMEVEFFFNYVHLERT